MIVRAGFVAIAVAGATAATSPAYAQSPPRTETSGWQQRLSPAPKAEPKAGTKVRSSKVDPSQAPKVPMAQPAAQPALRPSLGPATSPLRQDGDAAAAGGDAAYEAFDQGKYLTALALAAKQAEAGDAIAHTLVARIHAEGLGVPQDTKLAAQWYARGAELGDPEAALGLGTLYARGDGVPQDYNKAAELFEKSAAKGHPEAAYNLALLFLAGKGKAELPMRGFMLMSYAAEKGVTAAMYDLGTLYATGTGTTANVFEAAKWIGKAANAGYPEAEVEFAIILLKDHDVPPEQREKLRRRGVELLNSAARKGIVVAQNRLARCYQEGIGTAKNLVEAAKWHLVAKAGGYDDAALDKLLAGLSTADRQKATAAATEWREQTLLE
jgi:TPR repeat protein